MNLKQKKMLLESLEKRNKEVEEEEKIDKRLAEEERKVNARKPTRKILKKIWDLI